MKIKNMIRGVEILSKYIDTDEFIGGAEHDIVYFCPYEPAASQMTPDEKIELEERLNWFESEGSWSFFA
jgi:hypothetical protein